MSDITAFKDTKLEILNIDTCNGSFLLRVNDLNLIPQVLTHIVEDSSVAGDTHSTIVIGSCIAVETDSIGRASSLANEIKEKFNGKECDKNEFAELKEKILVLEKSYKKLVKKFVHEASVAESYRSLVYKDDALEALEKDDVVSYNLLSKKSDNCYRHANRLRGIFRKMSQEQK